MVIFVNNCFHFVAFLVVTSLWTLSLFERVRAVPQPSITVEQLLLAVCDEVGHGNIAYASCIHKGVVFVKQPELVNQLTHFNKS